MSATATFSSGWRSRCSPWRRSSAGGGSRSASTTSPGRLWPRPRSGAAPSPRTSRASPLWWCSAWSASSCRWSRGGAVRWSRRPPGLALLRPAKSSSGRRAYVGSPRSPGAAVVVTGLSLAFGEAVSLVRCWPCRSPRSRCGRSTARGPAGRRRVRRPAARIKQVAPPGRRHHRLVRQDVHQGLRRPPAGRPPAASLASPASFNNLAGLARAVNEHLVPGTEVFVAEMGTYGPGEIADCAGWFPPERRGHHRHRPGPPRADGYRRHASCEAKAEILEQRRRRRCSTSTTTAWPRPRDQLRGRRASGDPLLDGRPAAPTSSYAATRRPGRPAAGRRVGGQEHRVASPAEVGQPDQRGRARSGVALALGVPPTRSPRGWRRCRRRAPAAGRDRAEGRHRHRRHLQLQPGRAAAALATLPAPRSRAQADGRGHPRHGRARARAGRRRTPRSPAAAAASGIRLRHRRPHQPRRCCGAPAAGRR